MKTKKKARKVWTLKACKADAKRFKTRSEWDKNSTCGYTKARKEGWLDECCKHMKTLKKPNGYWTLKACMADAKKYNSKKEWERNSVTPYIKARLKGWLDKCCKHMEVKRLPDGYWSKERCIADAKNYNSKNEWRKDSSSAYQTANKNNWMDVCCKHMEEIRKPNGYWTFKTCKLDAQKYNSRNQWRKNSGGAYNKTIKEGWINRFSKHMKTLNANP